MMSGIVLVRIDCLVKWIDIRINSVLHTMNTLLPVMSLADLFRLEEYLEGDSLSES